MKISKKLSIYEKGISGNLKKLVKKHRAIEKNLGAGFLRKKETVYCAKCRKKYMKKDCEEWTWASDDPMDAEKILSCPRGHQID